MSTVGQKECHQRTPHEQPPDASAAFFDYRNLLIIRDLAMSNCERVAPGRFREKVGGKHNADLEQVRYETVPNANLPQNSQCIRCTLLLRSTLNGSNSTSRCSSFEASTISAAETVGSVLRQLRRSEDNASFTWGSSKPPSISRTSKSSSRVEMRSDGTGAYCGSFIGSPRRAHLYDAWPSPLAHVRSSHHTLRNCRSNTKCSCDYVCGFR